MPSLSAVAHEDAPTNVTSVFLATTVFFLWIFLGLAAVIYSLTCTARSGPFKMHVLGIVIAVLLGPFYWVFFAYNKDYCR